jgi:hypothetical protein
MPGKPAPGLQICEPLHTTPTIYCSGIEFAGCHAGSLVGSREIV